MCIDINKNYTEGSLELCIEIKKNNTGKDKEIIESLKSKKACLPCCRCNHGAIFIVGYQEIVLIASKKSMIKMVLVACANCGAVTQHCLDALK